MATWIGTRKYKRLCLLLGRTARMLDQGKSCEEIENTLHIPEKDIACFKTMHEHAETMREKIRNMKNNGSSCEEIADELRISNDVVARIVDRE